MRRFLLAMSAFAMSGVCVAVANDPPTPPASPQPVQPKVIIRGNPAAISRLEEELETLEAQRDTKKAYVKAAEIGVKAAEVGLQRIGHLFMSKVVTQEETDKARLDVDAAKAQLEIRVAEMREVEVKIKYARKRLDEAKTDLKEIEKP